MNFSRVLIVKKLISDGFFRIKCLGNSMYPTLKNEEIIEVKKFSREIVRGDLLLYYLYKNDEPIFVIHRVHYIDKEYVVLKGDNNVAFDIPIRKNQLLGFVNSDVNFNIDYKVAKNFWVRFKKNEKSSENYKKT